MKRLQRVWAPLVLAGMVALAIVAGMAARKPTRAPRGRGQYKKPTREVVTAIGTGQIDKAIKSVRAHLATNPKDAEYHYLLAVAYGAKREPDKAVAHAKLALDNGLPVGRFGAGLEGLHKPWVAGKAMAALTAGASRLVHGPMVGSVTHNSARIWVRTACQTTVTVDLSPAGKSTTVEARAATDHTAVIDLTGLKPDTKYTYTVKGAGITDFAPGRPAPSFRTFPVPGAKAKFRIAFGGGAGYTPWHEHMWATIAKRSPLAMLMLGDNVYIDCPKVPAAQQYCYNRRYSRPEYRALVARTAMYAIYDDHDFGTNDCIPGAEIDSPAWKRPAWRLFKRNWVNPYYGGGEKQPGCWFHFRIADVDFIMLDGRYYRANPGTPEATMLGPVQKKWLFERLKASTGTFKVLCSPVPWAVGTKGKSKDTWDGFANERKEILGFLAANKIEGVFLLSADRHRSDIWKLDRDGSYPLHEFESSRLTNVHTHGAVKGNLFSYNTKCSYGQLLFDTTGADPTVTYNIINIDDQLINTFVLKRSACR